MSRREIQMPNMSTAPPPGFKVRARYTSNWGLMSTQLTCSCGKTFDGARGPMIGDLAWDHYWTQHEPPICIGEYAQ